MPKNYSVHVYNPGDEVEIVRLLELVFDGWPHFDLECTNLDHWKWKYLERPLRMKEIALGVSNNKIIGCGHDGYLKIKIGKKIFTCSQGMDVAVHPDYRRMKVYTKITEKRKELRSENNVSLTYGATSHPIFMRRRKTEDPRFNVLDLIRIQDVDLHLKRNNTEDAWFARAQRKYGYLFLTTLNRIGNIFTTPAASTSKFYIEEISIFDERIESFWVEVKDKYSFIIERGREYLNWRYCDPRGGDYIIKQVEEEGHIIGYSILRINRYNDDYPTGYIVDLLTLPDRLDVADALIGDAIRLFNDTSVNLVHYWCIKNHPYERLFKRHGFVNSRTRLRISYNPINVGSEFNELKNATPKRLHFQYGDSDWI